MKNKILCWALNVLLFLLFIIIGFVTIGTSRILSGCDISISGNIDLLKMIINRDLILLFFSLGFSFLNFFILKKIYDRHQALVYIFVFQCIYLMLITALSYLQIYQDYVSTLDCLKIMHLGKDVEELLK